MRGNFLSDAYKVFSSMLPMLIPDEVVQPRVVLDAGGEVSAILSGAMYQCIDELGNGQVMQVISRDPTSRHDVPFWCLIAGHELIGNIEEGTETIFWIRKR